MTRIIAGAAQAVHLDVPRSGTRPTSDKVREALFSSLESWFELEDARVLDLYAGSGALALEAISRGASRAVLVEKAASAARLARQNAAHVREAMGDHDCEIDVVATSVHRYLADTVEEFDLVFIDPPYELDNATLLGDFEALLPHLHPDALVVVERSTRTDPLALPPGLAPWRDRSYGETTLHFLELPTSGVDLHH